MATTPYIKNPIWTCAPLATAWDGTTYFGGVASASASYYKPVYGQGTNFPAGFTLAEYSKAYYTTKIALASVNFTDMGGSRTLDCPAVFGGNPYGGAGYTWDSNYSPDVVLTDALGSAKEVGFVCKPKLSCYAYVPVSGAPVNTTTSPNFSAGELEAYCSATGAFYVPLVAGIEFDFSDATKPVVLGDDGLYYPFLNIRINNYTALDGSNVIGEGAPGGTPLDFTVFGKTVKMYGLGSGWTGSVDVKKYWTWGGHYDATTGVYSP